MPSFRTMFVITLAVFSCGFTLGAQAGPSASAAPGQDATLIVLTPPPPASPAVVTVTAPAAPPVTQAPVVTTPPPPPAVTRPAAVSAPETTEATETTPAADADTGATDDPAPTLPPVKHVWVVMLAQHGLQDGFGPDSHSVLLRETLPPKGLLLLDHQSVGRGSLANGLAVLTGARPRDEQLADCPVYGPACLVTSRALTDQFSDAKLEWKAYVEDLPAGCPPSPRNPFGYISSVVDANTACTTHIVGTDALDGDLANAEDTPAFSYVVPNVCHDGRDVPCGAGHLGGTAELDGWLRTTLRAIRASPAYKKDGMIFVTFDQGATQDPKVGALVLSHFLAPGTTYDDKTTHYSILKTIEDLFGFDHLGEAASDDVVALGPEQLTRPSN